MSTVLEYPSYDEAEKCLDAKDALEQYRLEKASDPDALVTLNELHCGEHWKVKVYKSRVEKERYLRQRVTRLLDRFDSVVSNLSNLAQKK